MYTLYEAIYIPQSLGFLKVICPKLYNSSDKNLTPNEFDEYRALIEFLWYGDIVRASHLGGIDESIWPRLEPYADKYNIPSLKHQCRQKFSKELIELDNNDKWQKLSQLYYNPTHWDAIITNNNGIEFKVHTYTLKYRSPIIYQALNSELIEGQTKRYVIDCSDKVLENTVYYLYHNNSLLSDVNIEDYVIELMDVSYQYSHWYLSYLCEKHIEKHKSQLTEVDIENIIPIFEKLDRKMLINNLL